MANVTTYGVTSIAFGDLANDGGPATTFTPLGLTEEGTAKITEDDPEETPKYAEESDDPYLILAKRGKRTLALSLTSLDVTAMQKVFGGTITAGPPKKLAFPDTLITLEKSVKITPKGGVTFILNRVQLRAKLNYTIGKKDVMLVDLTCNVLVPIKSGVTAVEAVDPA